MGFWWGELLSFFLILLPFIDLFCLCVVAPYGCSKYFAPPLRTRNPFAHIGKWKPVSGILEQIKSKWGEKKGMNGMDLALDLKIYEAQRETICSICPVERQSIIYRATINMQGTSSLCFCCFCICMCPVLSCELSNYSLCVSILGFPSTRILICGCLDSDTVSVKFRHLWHAMSIFCVHWDHSPVAHQSSHANFIVMWRRHAWLLAMVFLW